MLKEEAYKRMYNSHDDKYISIRKESGKEMHTMKFLICRFIFCIVVFKTKGSEGESSDCSFLSSVTCLSTNFSFC